MHTVPRVTLAAKLIGLDCVPEGKLWGAPGSKHAPGVFKSIDFDVSGLALEGPGLKTGPGGLKVLILTSASLLWRAPTRIINYIYIYMR